MEDQDNEDNKDEDKDADEDDDADEDEDADEVEDKVRFYSDAHNRIRNITNAADKAKKLLQQDCLLQIEKCIHQPNTYFKYAFTVTRYKKIYILGYVFIFYISIFSTYLSTHRDKK